MGYQKILNPTIKPTQGSVLDWENPLSPNIACWLFNERGGLKAYNLSQKYGIGILDPGVQWISKGRSEERRVGKECRSRWSQ